MKITDSPRGINRCPRCETDGSLQKQVITSKRERWTLICTKCGFDVHAASDADIEKIAEWMENEQ